MFFPKAVFFLCTVQQISEKMVIQLYSSDFREQAKQHSVQTLNVGLSVMMSTVGLMTACLISKVDAMQSVLTLLRKMSRKYSMQLSLEHFLKM
ncbi:hypothetical protein SDC9_203053 [bioreactor metagenome]|uniref:Uncharacterized protein n=1 Tax=bioreactor metagenome TaxID=1076179 RepID=A0A645IVK8_9ZZZZ